jgi:RHS repeat-associated protein
VLKAEPINIVTGEVVFEEDDFELPWRIPLTWTRSYRSGSTRIGYCGHGWETPADARLEFDDDGIVSFFDGSPGLAVFPQVPDEGPVREIAGGAILESVGDRLTVRTKGGLTYRFASSANSRELLVDRIADRYGNWIEFDRLGSMLREIRESSGIRIDVRTDGNRITRMSLVHPLDARPRPLVAYEYNDIDLIAAHDALGHPYNYAYANHRMIRHTSRVGLSFYYEYDGPGKDARVVRTWGDGGLYDFSITYYGDRERSTLAATGESTRTVLNELGQIIEEINAEGQLLRYEYDDAGRGIVTTDAIGRRWATEYDDRGNVTAIVRPDGTARRFAYDDSSRIIEITEPGDAVWKIQYGEHETISVSPLGAVWKHVMNDLGDEIAIDAPDGSTAYERDLHGNIMQITHPTGRRTQVRFDSLGLPIQASHGDARKVLHVRDLKGRLTRIRWPDGSEVGYAYDADDNLVSFRDEAGRITRYSYVGTGALSREERPDGTTVEYAYDALEQLLWVRDERGPYWELQRDSTGRIVAQIDPSGSLTRYEYDKAGNLGRLVRGDGRVVAFRYDLLDRLTGRDYGDGVFDQYEYDAAGNMVTATNEHSRVERKFDVAGNMVEEIQGDIRVISEYDPLGRRTRRSSGAHGHRLSFEYGTRPEPTSIRIDDSVNIRTEYRFDGRPVVDSIDGTLRIERSYSGEGLLESTHVTGPAGSLTRRFEYGADGNLQRRWGPDGASAEFHYDGAGRLVGQSTDGARLTRRNDQRYTFDQNGHLVARARPEGIQGFAWDVRGQLSEVTEPGRPLVSFRYDALGRRIEKKVDGVSRRFAWDADLLLSESLGDSPAREYVFREGSLEPIAIISEEISFCHTDGIGMTHDLIDGTGRVRWSTRFGPFGETIADGHTAPQNPLRFPGQYHDAETGLTYNRFRYYDPATGRFISPDPLGLEAGVDPYAYAPSCWTWLDPLGLNCWNDFRKALSNAGIKASPTDASRGWRKVKNGVGRVSRPTVTDPKLQNIVNDLYKGDRMPHVLGNGSTADAARIEKELGQKIHGRDHQNKAQEYIRAINNWERRNPGASAADKAAAKAMKDDMTNALAGN